MAAVLEEINEVTSPPLETTVDDIEEIEFFEAFEEIIEEIGQENEQVEGDVINEVDEEEDLISEETEVNPVSEDKRIYCLGELDYATRFGNKESWWNIQTLLPHTAGRSVSYVGVIILWIIVIILVILISLFFILNLELVETLAYGKHYYSVFWILFVASCQAFVLMYLVMSIYEACLKRREYAPNLVLDKLVYNAAETLDKNNNDSKGSEVKPRVYFGKDRKRKVKK